MNIERDIEMLIVDKTNDLVRELLLIAYKNGLTPSYITELIKKFSGNDLADYWEEQLDEL